MLRFNCLSKSQYKTRFSPTSSLVGISLQEHLWPANTLHGNLFVKNPKPLIFPEQSQSALEYCPLHFSILFCREDDLIVKIKDEVFYNERLPDTIVRDQCRIQGVRRRNGMTEIKILLVKEKHGLWLPRW